MKAILKKSSAAGVMAFVLTVLLLSLLLYVNKSPRDVNAASESVMQEVNFDESRVGHNPPTYLLIAIGVVGLIGIRRKVRKDCGVDCRAPQPDAVNEKSRKAELEVTS